MPQQDSPSVETDLIPPTEMLYDGSSSPEEFVRLGAGFCQYRIREFHAQVVLSPIELAYGDWCGRRALLGLQDVVIALKE